MNNIFDEAIRVGKEANARALKPCPISGGKCFYTYPPYPIPCEICQANLEQAKKREEAMKNETLLFMRAKR